MADDGIVIRAYRDGDARGLAALFFDSVHRATGSHYTPAQRRAWAPVTPDADLWARRMADRHTFVAERDGTLLGFTELEADGHIDMFYCHPSVIGQGVGKRLYDTLEERARALGLTRLTTEASLVAQPFFARQGFQVLARQQVIRHGVTLSNTRMAKDL